MGVTKQTNRKGSASQKKKRKVIKPKKYEITPPKTIQIKLDAKRKRDWSKSLRNRSELTKRGEATALGIHLVKNKLKTINTDLKQELLRKSPPLGFGELNEDFNRGEEILDCLGQLRELINGLSFHLDLDFDDVTKLPTYVPVTRKLGLFNLDSSDYHDLLNGSNKKVGQIGLVGLVNRYSSAVFSDHHGLVMHAKIDGCPDLNIYYQSLDATNNFSGGTSVRSSGSMLPFTSFSSDLRGAVGFSEQAAKLMITRQDINVVILAEVGLEDAKRLMPQRLFGGEWSYKTNKSKGSSGVNDITMMYDPKLESSYGFEVETSDIGNMATITSKNGCILAGCHILNKKANNKAVGECLQESKLSALFGDTNMSTIAKSSMKFGFQTIESNNSLTDSLSFSFSNSASDKMFDKLLVRTK
jgi:hypothetical protein